MKIGILGGGQLARMILEAGHKYGFEFHILSKEENSPAGKITKFETSGDWNDEECLKRFSENCDVITLENEFIDYQKIKFLEDTGIEVYPSSGIIELIQDKLIQKKYLKQNGIPVAEFAEVNSKEEILKFISENSYPVVLKSRTMGYDGKGNFTIKSDGDIKEAFDILSERGKLMCESFVTFEKEIATQVVRNKSGEVKVYTVVETIQKDHICNTVIASKNLFKNIRDEVESIAKKIVTDLNYVGVMGIEMFLVQEKIIVNELAPRVHNSGHYTIEACHTSQFENHTRAILNYPLGNTEMINENAVMINILGERNGKAELKNANKILQNKNIHLHIYGKENTIIGRKMGHITVTGNELQKVKETAEKARKNISI